MSNDSKIMVTLEQVKELRKFVRDQETVQVSAYIDGLTQWAEEAAETAEALDLLRIKQVKSL